MPEPKPISILFMCVANSARSQLAEGLAKSIFRGRAIIESAGSEPSGRVHPLAIDVLKADGIDISANCSKSTADLAPSFLSELDYIITLCAEETCPTLSSRATRLHWPIPDPANAPDQEKQRAFQIARDDLRQRLNEFFRAVPTGVEDSPALPRQ